MANYICATCGVQYTASEQPPSECAICKDERQYIGHQGQRWTTLETLRQAHQNKLSTLESNLTAIYSEPRFAIGQQAKLIQTPQGNILWDCITLIDEATVEAVNGLGGISAIAISHPHFYDSMVEWSHMFGKVPIYLHSANRQWVMRPDPVIEFWEGNTFALSEGITLIRCGGHFTGSTVLHWATGADGKGLLLTGDTIYVVADRRYVSFMYSYPNNIPLSANAVRHIVEAIEPFEFGRIYGGWEGSVVMAEAKTAVHRSAERYIKAIEGFYDNTN